jgi:hypothetical protein
LNTLPENPSLFSHHLLLWHESSKMATGHLALELDP